MAWKLLRGLPGRDDILFKLPYARKARNLGRCCLGGAGPMAGRIIPFCLICTASLAHRTVVCVPVDVDVGRTHTLASHSQLPTNPTKVKIARQDSAFDWSRCERSYGGNAMELNLLDNTNTCQQPSNSLRLCFANFVSTPTESRALNQLCRCQKSGYSVLCSIL